MAGVKIQHWINQVEAVLDSRAEISTLSRGDTKTILLRIQKVVKAQVVTAADLKLGCRAILLLFRIPHTLEAGSLALLVEVVDSLIFELLSQVTAGNDKCRQDLREAGELVTLVLVWLRTMCIKELNTLLVKAKKEEKSLVWEKLNMKVEVLFSFIFTCGVYDSQAAAVELMFRIGPKDELEKTAETLIVNDKAVQLFMKSIDGGSSNFEATCRIFLNQLNLSLGPKCKVFTLPIIACTVEGRSVLKPDSTDFWVDFSMGNEDRGLAFYGMEEEGDEEGWQLEVILEEDVLEARVSLPTPKHMLLSISRLGSRVSELTMDYRHLNQMIKVLRQLFGSRLKEPTREPNMSKPEASSTPKKTLLLAKEEKQYSEVVESPENTSIPPSEEEGDHGSMPCAQAPQEHVEKEVRSKSQIKTYSRQVREEKQSRGNSKARVGMSTPRSKVGGVKSYSPVVTIGEAKVGIKAKKMGNMGGTRDVGKKKEELVTKVEKGKLKMSEHLSSTNALLEENLDQMEATPEMVGGPGMREDVSMTRSGGRKRAVRKIPESSRQKMQDRAKPIQLDFQDEAAVMAHEASLGEPRGLVENNKSGTCEEESTSRGRKAALGLKKILGKVPRALGFGKNNSRRVSVSPTLGDISEVSARGFQKRRASSVLGAGGEKKRRLAQKSDKAANQRGAEEDPRESVCEAEIQKRRSVRISSPKKVQASHQEKIGVDYHNEVQGECEEEMVEANLQEEIGFDLRNRSKNQSSPTTLSCQPLEGEDENEGHLYSKDKRLMEKERGLGRSSGDGNSLQGACSGLQQEMSKQEAAGLSFLRLANPLIDILMRASTGLRRVEQHEGLKEGWMAIKKALVEQDDK